jgi:hypothetical protein
MMQKSGSGIWERYPAHYRAAEIQALLRAVRAGECAAALGLSGSGKSNLLGFLAGRAAEIAPWADFLRLDCNRVSAPTASGFYRLALSSLDAPEATSAADAELPGLLGQAITARLDQEERPLCLLLDRFDALFEAGSQGLFSNLRALRDEHKYSLTYVISSRKPLAAQSELAELFFGHSAWLGPLSAEDARWSANEYGRRSGLAWSEDQLESILALSGRYPSFLRAACQAAADGCALTLPALLAHPAVQARLEEFWLDAPSAETLRASRLDGNPFLSAKAPAPTGTPELTAKEKLLLDALQARTGQVCEKDELIAAVWPEDLASGQGLRDDSLAQLVRRLREKVEPDPAHPRRILTVPGRGYRYQG